MRESHDGQNVFGNACTGGARGEKWFLRFAPPVQAFPKALWLLLRAIKDILQGLGSPFFRRTHVIYNMSVTWSDSSPADCIVQTTATDRAERPNPLGNCTIRASYVHFGGIMEQRLYALISLRP